MIQEPAFLPVIVNLSSDSVAVAVASSIDLTVAVIPSVNKGIFTIIVPVIVSNSTLDSIAPNLTVGFNIGKQSRTYSGVERAVILSVPWNAPSVSTSFGV